MRGLASITTFVVLLVAARTTHADLPNRARAPQPTAIERSMQRASTGSPHAARPRRQLPAALRVELFAAHETFDLGGLRFVDLDGALQMRGEGMGLGHTRGFGGGFSLGLAGEHVGGAFRFSYVAPDHRGASALGAPLQGLHVARWALELGWMHRYGDLVPFAVVQAAMLRATVDLEEPFTSLHAWRFSLGPRLGFRAFLHRAFYVSGAYFLDVLQRRAHVVTLGLGVGRR
ncbi:MAG: hypothetical protein H6721_18585 [Sandaracinus sp.]|nr:hypothetical protein [Sandaracinus sp.]MCB9613897.1 hypothetical protein [Sandaracinus sp.]MCB9634133.1 hypothetical protein [Sandaracinus sp.]